MNILFYLSAIVAVLATVLVITRTNAVHALLYLIVSLLAVALVFFAFGAVFAAALEVIIYAGAIMVLFIFMIMMLNLGGATAQQESQWLRPGIWWGPALLCGILALELAYFFLHDDVRALSGTPVAPKQVGIALYGPYALGVELASMLLLAGLVGAYHLGRREQHD
jgi:NADH-quinone oxidoreductase subunit J